MDRIGRYRIVRELGRGAMGVVYHAIDPHIGRPVAIKTIELNTLRKPEEQERLRERLFREARSAGILSHPGIVTIYDVDQQGDLAYIAMEYVDGPTLDHLLSGDQPLEAQKVLSYLAQTAVALDYAHQKGIVHRDIKPANIMIASGGATKITDFGIAKITASDQFTMTGTIVGTPHYMSPEQVQGRAVDGRSDQFSLGVMAFEMLTGEKPYTGENLTTVAYKIVSEEPVPPHRLNPTLAGSIDAVLRRALSKKPDSRFRTCQEFSDALERACAATAGWRTMPRGGSLNEPTVNQPRVTPTLPPARRPVRRDGPATGEHTSRKSAMLTFILLILAAAGLLALVGTRALPWLNPKIEIPKSEPRVEAPPLVETPKPQVPPPAAPDPADEKPSPMPVPPEKKESASAAQPETALTSARITVISSPGGATATLDGRDSCTTPCSLDAAPGRHSVSVVLAGYQVERRDVTLAAEREIELPIVVMRNTGGTVMLSSVPNGAAVIVNGRRTGQTTPVQLVLAPGTYSIGVEKDGRQTTQTVEVSNGLTALRIQLGQ